MAEGRKDNDGRARR